MRKARQLANIGDDILQWGATPAGHTAGQRRDGYQACCKVKGLTA